MSSEEKSPDGPQKKNVDVNDLFCLEAVSEWGSTMEQRMEQAEWHFKEWQHENEETEKRLQNQILDIVHKLSELESILAVLRKKLLTRQDVLRKELLTRMDGLLDIQEHNHMTLHLQIEKNKQNLEDINLILQKKLLTHSQLGGRKTHKRKTKKKRKKKRKRRKKRKTKRRR